MKRKALIVGGLLLGLSAIGAFSSAKPQESVLTAPGLISTKTPSAAVERAVVSPPNTESLPEIVPSASSAPVSTPTAIPIPAVTPTPTPIMSTPKVVSTPRIVTPIPTKLSTPAPVSESTASCDPNYSPCIPQVSYDLNCGDIKKRVRVIGADRHNFDGDNDGFGCESYR